MSNDNKPAFKEGEVKELLAHFHRDKLSIGRFTEILNEKMELYHQQQSASKDAEMDELKKQIESLIHTYGK